MTDQPPEITSFSNPLVKKIRSLAYKKYRKREGVFWAEGVRNTLEAIDNGWDIDMLVYAPSMLRSNLARERIEQSDLRKVTVADRVFERIAASELPQGLGAVVRLPERTLADIAVAADTFVVVLEEPQDRGNVGAVVRTVDAAGGQGVILVGQAVDPFDPEALRTSMGAIFAVPVVNCNADEFLGWSHSNQLHLVGTSARAEAEFRQVEYPRPLALVFGNERVGLSDTLQDAVDIVANIPILGRANSLNLGASVAIMAYQAQGAWTSRSTKHE
jgi:TrmH family RNA methyltransferase